MQEVEPFPKLCFKKCLKKKYWYKCCFALGLEWHYKIDLVRGFLIIRDLQKHVERINTIVTADLKVLSKLNILWNFIVDHSWIFNIRVHCGTHFSRNGKLLLFFIFTIKLVKYMFIMKKGSSLFKASSVYIWSLVSYIVSTYIVFSLFLILL